MFRLTNPKWISNFPAITTVESNIRSETKPNPISLKKQIENLLAQQDTDFDMSLKEIKNTEKSLDLCLQNFCTQAECKAQVVANRFLDKASLAKTENEKRALELKTDLFLSAKAPAVRSPQEQLEIEVNSTIDNKDPNLHKILEFSSNSHFSVKEKLTFIRSKKYEQIPDVYYTKSVQGIPNGGNTCFMNAGFQLIMNNPSLLQALVETYKTLAENEDIDGLKRYVYKNFLTDITNYQNGHVTELNLSYLRILFSDPETQQEGTFGDVTEFMDALLQPIDSTKYPHLFCQIEEVKQFEPILNPDDELQEDLRYRSREFESCKDIPGWVQNKYTTLPQNGTISKIGKFSTLMIPVPESKNSVTGQHLLDHYFSKKHQQEDAPVIYQQEGTLQSFSVVSSQNILDTAPELLNISFNRFRENGSKIESQVDMPKKITIPLKSGFQEYELQSVAIHTEAHYIALIKKDAKSLIADDSSIYEANPRHIEHAMTKGYLYVYKRCETTSNSATEQKPSPLKSWLTRLLQ